MRGGEGRRERERERDGETKREEETEREGDRERGREGEVKYRSDALRRTSRMPNGTKRGTMIKSRK